jgi:hypothetical protein
MKGQMSNREKLAMAMFHLGVADAMLEKLKGTGDERIKAIQEDRKKLLREIEGYKKGPRKEKPRAGKGKDK